MIVVCFRVLSRHSSGETAESYETPQQSVATTPACSLQRLTETVGHEQNILYLFSGSEVALRTGRGQRPHELHAPLPQPCEDVVIPGKRNWEAVRMTQFRFYDVTVAAA
jgi:hypothetical protein